MEVHGAEPGSDTSWKLMGVRVTHARTPREAEELAGSESNSCSIPGRVEVALKLTMPEARNQ